MNNEYLRRFEDTDWISWPNAEVFTDGSEPFIYIQSFDEIGEFIEVNVMADVNGIKIALVYSDYKKDDLIWVKEDKLSSYEAEQKMDELIDILQRYTQGSALQYALTYEQGDEFLGFEKED